MEHPNAHISPSLFARISQESVKVMLMRKKLFLVTIFHSSHASPLQRPVEPSLFVEIGLWSPQQSQATTFWNWLAWLSTSLCNACHHWWTKIRKSCVLFHWNLKINLLCILLFPTPSFSQKIVNNVAVLAWCWISCVVLYYKKRLESSPLIHFAAYFALLLF